MLKKKIIILQCFSIADFVSNSIQKHGLSLLKLCLGTFEKYNTIMLFRRERALYGVN